jgi:pyridoxal phosphate enzyme (YggS family)
MSVNTEAYQSIMGELTAHDATLVAVSKLKPPEAIEALYALGHRDFGENYVQELVDKQSKLPAEIRWHFIGHLQRNKVKYLAPFVYLIHGVDSEKLLQEIDRQAVKVGRVIDVLLQVHIATEESKFGFDAGELAALLETPEKIEGLAGIRLRGLMGMASFSEDSSLVRQEFQTLRGLFVRYKTAFPHFDLLSMGMSGDYGIALSEGSNMVRIGSLLFGRRS